MSGCKQPRTDGVILMKTSGREQVEKLIVEDPLHREDVAEYTIIELISTKVTEGPESCLETI